MLIPERLFTIGDDAYTILAHNRDRTVERAAWDIIRLVDEVLIPYGQLIQQLTDEELQRAKGQEEVSSAPGASLRSAPSILPT